MFQFPLAQLRDSTAYMGLLVSVSHVVQKSFHQTVDISVQCVCR